MVVPLSSSMQGHSVFLLGTLGSIMAARCDEVFMELVIEKVCVNFFCFFYFPATISKVNC